MWRFEKYGEDRVFVYIRFASDGGGEDETHVAALERAGQAVMRTVRRDLYEIGQTFFQWEIATAVAGSLIGIDAFNQPDLEASKVVTREPTIEYEKRGSLPAGQADFGSGRDSTLYRQSLRRVAAEG